MSQKQVEFVGSNIESTYQAGTLNGERLVEADILFYSIRVFLGLPYGLRPR
jgi:hypothetical protein